LLELGIIGPDQRNAKRRRSWDRVIWRIKIDRNTFMVACAAWILSEFWSRYPEMFSVEMVRHSSLEMLVKLYSLTFRCRWDLQLRPHANE
jgi:hypothetical protein